MTATIAADAGLLDGVDGGYRLSTGGDLQIQVDGTRVTMSPIGQSAVNAVFFPKESRPGAYQDLNLRSNALVAAAVRGDSTVFLDEFPDRSRAARVQRFLTDWVHGLEEESAAPMIVIDCRPLQAHEARKLIFGTTQLRSVSDSSAGYGAVHLAHGGTLVLHHADETEDRFPCRHTLNAEQIEWFRAGSALNWIRNR